MDDLSKLSIYALVSELGIGCTRPKPNSMRVEIIRRFEAQAARIAELTGTDAMNTTEGEDEAKES